MSGRQATNRNDEGIVLRVPWSHSNRPLPGRLLRPLQSFLEQETASGVVLLAAAVAALVWANSPWRTSFDALWSNQLSLVGVADKGDLIGGIPTDQLVGHFLRSR